MNYKQAKKKVFIMLWLSVLICVPSLISTLISILKMFALRLDDGSAIGYAVSDPFRKIVYSIYERSRFLDFFWNNSPVPNPLNFYDEQSIKFIGIYVVFFIGWVIFNSGKKLRSRLKQIDEEIENQMLMYSIGRNSDFREAMELQVNLSKSSKIHDLYIAPLIVTIVGGVIGAILIHLLDLSN